MRPLTIALIAAAAALASGCTTTRDDLSASSIRLIYVTEDGEALGLVRAFDDGRRTTLQFRLTPPQGLQVLDINGRPLPYERLGQYIALQGLHDRLQVVLADLRADVRVSAGGPKAELIEQPAAAPRATLDLPPKPAAPLVAKAPPRAPTQELLAAQRALKLAERQLDELRGLVNTGTASRASVDLTKTLDRIEKTVADAAAVILRVEFGFNSVDFAPRPDVAQALVAAASKADRITVRSYTDSAVVDDANRKVALARALAARQFLIERGVDPQRIRAFYNSAGGFIADNNTPEGRAQNRRVEVEIQNSRIARLASTAANLSSNME